MNEAEKRVWAAKTRAEQRKEKQKKNRRYDYVVALCILGISLSTLAIGLEYGSYKALYEASGERYSIIDGDRTYPTAYPQELEDFKENHPEVDDWSEEEYYVVEDQIIVVRDPDHESMEGRVGYVNVGDPYTIYLQERESLRALEITCVHEHLHNRGVPSVEHSYIREIEGQIRKDPVCNEFISRYADRHGYE